MRKYGIIAICLPIILFVMSGMAHGQDSTAEAWTALHNLQISEAKRLFTQELKKSPEEVALMRGLLLAAYFDMDHKVEAEMIKAIAEADPGGAYLMAIYRHLMAYMLEWRDRQELEKALGEAMLKDSVGPIRFFGEIAKRDLYKSTHNSFSGEGPFKSLFAPGCWLAGPFDNHSNIAAYRPIPGENAPLDTAAVTIGMRGARAGWSWLESDYFGDLFPTTAIEDESDIALHARFYFELPADMDILILFGGSFSFRVLLNGRKIDDDPIYRSVFVRSGYQTSLAKGIHELTVIPGSTTGGIGLRVAVRDPDYKPIKGLKWHRYAVVPKDSDIAATKINPVLDPLTALTDDTNADPDARYWKATTQIHGGFKREAVLELEALQAQENLTLLEYWTLYQALRSNNEESRALGILGYLKEHCSTPRSDAEWYELAIDNYEERINTLVELAEIYPDRPELEVRAAIRRFLDHDYDGYVSALRDLLDRYPEAVFIRHSLIWLYDNIMEDPSSSYNEFTRLCKETNQKFHLWVKSGDYLIAMGKYDEAIKAAKKLLRTFPLSEVALNQLMTACEWAQRTDEVEPILLDLKSRYPYNIETYSKLYDTYNRMGDYVKARGMLEQIHFLKPSAGKPYLHLDSLHNNFPYDSIFGTLDAETYWDVEPDEQELAGANYWNLIDRQQVIIFASGIIYNDIHYATVVIDQDAVEEKQEYRLDFDPDNAFNKLLLARRLRKGQPPLSGTTRGRRIVFKDLKPGDAVEIRYRKLYGSAGDLWKDFWNAYPANTGYYQRYWEYSILTNRDDISHLTISPAPEPDSSTHCGFTKISWRDEKCPGLHTELELLPPEADISGRIFISTLSDWETLRRWFKSISAAILDENPRADKLALELTSGLGTEREKLEAIYKYIAVEVPYQTIGFDYDAAVPTKPDEVLVRRWGDCKDKTHLLIKMLHKVGIEAWPVLVMMRNNGTRLPMPLFGFDHMIASCIIDNDTVFTDISDIPFYPDRSNSVLMANQPCMSITDQRVEAPGRMPPIRPDDYYTRHKMEIKPQPDGDFNFTHKATFYNMNAGYRRNNLKGFTLSSLKAALESAYSENLGVELAIDSIAIDSITAIDTAFHERYIGKISLKKQTIGDLTIVNLPDWSMIDEGFLTRLTHDGMREYPIDLRYLVRHYEHEMSLFVPEEWGEPRLNDPLVLTDSLFEFSYRVDWDNKARRFDVAYMLLCRDGHTELENFLDFARRVIEAYKQPLVLEAGKRK